MEQEPASGKTLLETQALESLPEWKKDLLGSLVSMIKDLPDEKPIEPSALASGIGQLSSPIVDQEPTIEEFYQAFIALEANTKKSIQKTNGALDNVANQLRQLRRQFSELEVQDQKDADSAYLTTWISLDSQIRRMLDFLAKRPKSAPFGLSQRWETGWDEALSGAEIIHKSLTEALNQLGVRSDFPIQGASFDAATMEAIKVTVREPTCSAENASSKPAFVLETLEPAYYHRDQLVRAARVHVERG